MDYSQNSSNDILESTKYYLDSIPRITKAEESALWRQYTKWRYIKRILDSESVRYDMPEASPIVFSQIIQELSNSNDLIVCVRHNLGLDKLGDTIVSAENNTNIAIELYRLIQYSERTNDEKKEQRNTDTCCLEDLFGYILGETLNNIAFGKGNPNLVDKIAKANNCEPTDVKDKLFELTICRVLVPRGLLNCFDPKTPINKLPYLIQSIHPNVFQFAYDDYRSLILSIKSEGEQAFKKLVESHLWLVVNIVNKNFNQDVGMQFDDLIQEGNLGLIEAAERFQPVLNTRFMSYAHWWVFQKIQRAISDQSLTIRIPAHMRETINKLLKTSLYLGEKYGREPTITEIAEQMEISTSRVKEIIKIAQPYILFESVVGQEKHLADYITDTNTISLDGGIDRQLLKEQINKLMYSLKPREQKVIKLRFGLEDGRSRTLEEIGQEFNLTRERIRQIEAKALEKLRHPSRSQKLKEYLE